MINKELLNILRCPESKAPVILDKGNLVSLDKYSRRSYSIVNDVPILLVNQSTQLTTEAWTDAMKRNGKSV